MKRLKIVTLMLIIMMVTVLAVNNVYATNTYREKGIWVDVNQYYYWDREEEIGLDFYYPGDTIEIDIAFEENYYTSLPFSNKKITDFEIGMTRRNAGAGGPAGLTPIFEGVNGSDKSHSIYYIQQLPMAQKLTFVGGEHLAEYVDKIDDDYFASLPDKSDEDYYSSLSWERAGFAQLHVKYYLEDGTMMEFTLDKMELPIIPYVSGDFNLDKDVDFFDITSLITAVYETETETLGWRNREAVTTNTKEYTSDENYNHRTAELGFTDIIYLIKEIYG